MSAVATASYAAILHGISAPDTVENLRASIAWQRAEGGTARNNPFNTTMPAPGAGWYNSFGPDGEYHVRNYPNIEVGIAATVKTLLNGNYPAILAAFRAGDHGLHVVTAIDASHWGTHGATRTYLRLYGHPAATIPPRRLLRLTTPYLHGSDVRRAQEALTRHEYFLEPDGIFGPRTAAAIRDFQREHHLVTDGIIGPRTWHALGA